MRLSLVRILEMQRDLYDLPRGMARFQEYIEKLTGGTKDMMLPLSGMNPMGKEKAKEGFDRLIAVKAEDVAELALEDTQGELQGVDAEFRVALTLADDAQGGWTDRTLTEMHERADLHAMFKRGWIVATFWSSETPDADAVRRTVRAAVFRTLWQQRRGAPKTLDDWLAQEGNSLRFAGFVDPLGAATRASAAKRLEPLRTERSFGRIFAVLYGDEQARMVGYEALGFRSREGFDLALSQAHNDVSSPERRLFPLA